MNRFHTYKATPQHRARGPQSTLLGWLAFISCAALIILSLGLHESPTPHNQTPHYAASTIKGPYVAAVNKYAPADVAEDDATAWPPGPHRLASWFPPLGLLTLTPYFVGLLAPNPSPSGPKPLTFWLQKSGWRDRSTIYSTPVALGADRAPAIPHPTPAMPHPARISPPQSGDRGYRSIRNANLRVRQAQHVDFLAVAAYTQRQGCPSVG